MRALLDTCTFVWLIAAPENVPESTRDWLEREPEEILVSAASAWELSIKRKLGKLGELSAVARDLDEFVHAAIDTYLFASLPISLAHALAAGDLPTHHRDPFDRMLIAQARLEELVLVSPDVAFDTYGVDRKWS